jgi:D-alanyl-lipoteichoic acid acyltransferase DltB (MBOAT superfamily)
MLFPTLEFLLFFLLVMLAAAALDRRHEARKLMLVAASYFFYAQWNWRFCFLLATSSVVSYGAGRAIAASRLDTTRRRIVAAAVTAHLGLLGFFKYYDFFTESLNDLLRDLGATRDLPFIEVILPVGISFFTFHGISYVVDVYRGDVAVCRRLTDMLLYISFFPQLVAGPIVRASKFLPQLYSPQPRRIQLAPAMVLILGGLFKKVVVANYLATDLVDPVFADPGGFPSADLLLAAYGYAVQIYCDFSAYSDMAIGLAALLGYSFPVNFDQPYRATSLRDFWRRWHISLSSWLRDYLYKPLGGSRGGVFQTRRNLMITMLLGGVWHGAAWKFVAWGGLHGAALIAERPLLTDAPLGGWRKALAILLTFHFVCLCWIFFRADGFDTTLLYLQSMAQLTPGIQQTRPFTLGLVALGMGLHFVPRDAGLRVARWIATWPEWAVGGLAGTCAIGIHALGPDGVAPFIYFQF